MCVETRTVARLHLSEGAVASARCLPAAAAELEFMNCYPDPDCRVLVDALARRWELRPDNFVVGNGSDELILLCALVLGAPASPGVITAGTFAGHRYALELARRDVREVPLGDGRVDVGRFVDALPGAGVAFLCSPHNPSGVAMTRAELAVVVEAAIAADTTLVVDEAYMEFATDDAGSATEWTGSDASVVALRTFSKAYGLAGLRIGYAMTNTRDASALRHAQRVLPFRVNRPAQAAAVAALEDGSCLERVRAETTRRRMWFTRALREAGFDVRDSSTNFVAVPVADPADVRRTLEDRYGIAVRDTSDMGFPGHIRISLGADDDLRRVIAALAVLCESTDQGRS